MEEWAEEKPSPCGQGGQQHQYRHEEGEPEKEEIKFSLVLIFLPESFSTPLTLISGQAPTKGLQPSGLHVWHQLHNTVKATGNLEYNCLI